jgi:hypothetical protein
MLPSIVTVGSHRTAKARLSVKDLLQKRRYNHQLLFFNEYLIC